MKPVSGLLLAVAMLLPTAVSAQKPSDVSETRSADVYLANADKSTLNSEKKELYEQAIAIALQGAQKYPTNPKPWLQIGRAYHKLNDYVGADSAFAKAEKMYPPYAKEIEPERRQMWVSVFNESVKKIRANDAAGGIELLKLASRLDPSNPLAEQSLGSIYLQMGDLKGAETAYRNELAIIRAPTRKKQDAKKEAEYADMELNAVKALATMMSELNRYADAEAMYRELLARNPENPAVMSNLAITMSRAGKTAEANDMYNKLLARTDLTGIQLLNVGIGLHNAGQYAKAAEAFERASLLSPYSHDILDFRVRALSGAVDELIKQKEGKTGAAAKAVDDLMLAQFQKTIDAGTRVLALDPANALVVATVADAQRRTMDITADPVKKKAVQQEVLATLTKLQAMAYSISDVQSNADEKTITLSGSITGLEAARAGQQAKLRFHLLDKDGKSVAQKETTIPVPAKEEKKSFTITIDAPATAVAWKYEIL